MMDFDQMIMTSQIKTILSYWDANAYSPEDAPEYLVSCSQGEKEAILLELRVLAEDPHLAELLTAATSFEVSSRVQAQNFVHALEHYLFSDGAMPQL